MDNLPLIVTILLIAAIFLVAIRLNLRMKLFWEFGIFPSRLTQRMIAVEIAKLFIQYRQSLDDDRPNDEKIEKASTTTELFTELYGISPVAFLVTTYAHIMLMKKID
jgi:hypothetical protein